MSTQLNLDDLPEETQRELYEELSKKFRINRDRSTMTKEQKVKALADVLRIISPFTIAQQRSILQFAQVTIENAQHRWWRSPKNGNHNKPGVGKRVSLKEG